MVKLCCCLVMILILCLDFGSYVFWDFVYFFEKVYKVVLFNIVSVISNKFV